MWKTVVAKIMQFIKKPTVAKILKGFHKTISQLESVEAAKALEVKLYSELIDNAETDRAYADLERVRAGSIAKKIKHLVGPDTEKNIKEEDWS